MSKQNLLISRAQIFAKINLLLATNNLQQFTGTFITKENKVRTMTGMVGVQAGVKGTGANWDREAKGLISVHECQNPKLKDLKPEQKKRHMNVNTMLTFKIDGNLYQVVDGLTDEQIDAANKMILEQRQLAAMNKEAKKNKKNDLKQVA